MDGPGGDAATLAPPAAAGELSVRDAAASVLVALLLGFLLRRWVKRTPRVLARDTRRGHRWCHTGMFSQPSYCNVCESLLMTSRGAFCDACGVCACPTCVRPANKQLTCKAVTSRDASHKHHWIQGNLPFDSSCEVCDGSVGDSPELSGQRCCWCHRTVHDGCRRNISEVCDLGEFAQYVVPPTCVKVRATATVPRRLAISQVSRPATAAATTAVTAAASAGTTAGATAIGTTASSTTSSASTAAEKPWTPLIVLGNRKSGSTDAEQVLSAFRRYLNPAQVVDLGDQRPEDGLEWCHLVGPERCRVLVAGGDGTVDWVLNAIENLQLQPPPAVGILPLGTGNDLSRVLGSGEAYVEVDPERVLRRLQRADVINVDRWLVRLDPVRHVHLPGSEVRMTNYVSLGVDALVTLNFHKTRESPHYLWSSRLVNKLIYFCYGTKDVLERECHHLQEKLTLKMDGREVELPDIEALVVQNIATWGAGVRPWELGQGGGAAWVQRPDDGLLEVFCVYSSFHIAQMQVGLSEPLRLGQARNVEISLRAKVPMQLDGEPWEQGPCVIRVTHHNQARMLRMPTS